MEINGTQYPAGVLDGDERYDGDIAEDMTEVWQDRMEREAEDLRDMWADDLDSYRQMEKDAIAYRWSDMTLGCGGTCLYRLCKFVGVEVAGDVTRVEDIDGGTRAVLCAVTAYRITVLVTASKDDRSNHVEPTPSDEPLKGASVPVESGGVAESCVTFEQFFAVQDAWRQFQFFSSGDDYDKAVSAMEKYHEYLENNYDGGSQRFFSPTGALETFESTVRLSVQDARRHVVARTIDEAAAHIQPIVAGDEGVFDLAAEPGTGKTSVLPFRFPSKRVMVVLPTPFEAYSAYQMATGDCVLRLKGLRLGKLDRVCYTDSYYAASKLLSGELDYDVVLVDECDSPKGVTPFLGEVRAPGKVVIRMSATHGVTHTGPSRSFQIVEAEDMPDVRDGVMPLATYVRGRRKGRCMVLTPDAQAASELASRFDDAKLLCVDTGLGDMAKCMINQEPDVLVIADDVSGRGLNLNLDAVFDCQLVTEYGVTRHITAPESVQRKHRVGRNRGGFYYCPGLEMMPSAAVNEVDMFRHNVMRCVADVRQCGDRSLRVTTGRAKDLVCATREPYVLEADHRKRCLSLSKEASESPSVSLASSRVGAPSVTSVSAGSVRSSFSSFVKPAPWTMFFGSGSVAGAADTYVARRPRGMVAYRRRGSSDVGSGSSSTSSSDGRSRVQLGFSSVPVGFRDGLPLAPQAPYAGTGRLNSYVEPQPVSVPLSPPIMDLTAMTYDLDWPALIRDCLESGRALPTLVPPDSWRHTSSGGMKMDWVRRLSDVALGEPTFDGKEFEIVCRAWNDLVARTWVKATSGLSSWSNRSDIEFCARYFQSYYMLSSAG